jgi:hypothetical protein
VNGVFLGSFALARLRAFVLAGLLGTALFSFATASIARASTATLSKVHGKATLTIKSEKREENTVYIQVESDRRHFILEDAGQDAINYEENALSFKASQPGCSVVTYSTYDPDPSEAFLRCEIAAVDRIKADLGDQDDLIRMGDDILAWTAPKIPVSVNFGSGADILIGGPRNDKANGGPGNDILTGYQGNDKLIGGPGSDVLTGDKDYSFDPKPGGGNDVMIGGGRRDYIHPGSGKDRVLAGGGNDIVGSAVDKDRDVLNCGAGRGDSLLGANSRGARLKEKGLVGCETVSSGGLTSDRVWHCNGRRCTIRHWLRSRPLSTAAFDR